MKTFNNLFRFLVIGFLIFISGNVLYLSHKAYCLSGPEYETVQDNDIHALYVHRVQGTEMEMGEAIIEKLAKLFNVIPETDFYHAGQFQYIIPASRGLFARIILDARRNYPRVICSREVAATGCDLIEWQRICYRREIERQRKLKEMLEAEYSEG